jgi:hypothetical protein
MKKTLLSIIAFLGVCSVGFSQLSIQDTLGNTFTNGDTVTVTGLAGTQLSGKYFIYNGAIPLSTQILCVPTSVRVKASYSLCVGSLCYSPCGDSVNFLSNSFKAPSGLDPNALFADYNANTVGTTVIRYDVRSANLTDSSWIFVRFIAAPAGIASIAADNMHVSALYPNPADREVNFTYHTDYTAQLSIYNSIGQLVKAMSLTPAKENVSIATTGMPSGIYICKVQTADGVAVLRRLVVSH